MATSRMWIIVVRARRNVLKFIRGFIAERDDSEFTDTLTATSPPNPVPYTGDERGGWQRPVISAPIPTLSDERLCMWGIRASQLPAATEARLDAEEQARPTLIRTFKQQGSVVDGAFVPSETPAQMVARVKGLINWIDKPNPLST